MFCFVLSLFHLFPPELIYFLSLYRLNWVQPTPQDTRFTRSPPSSQCSFVNVLYRSYCLLPCPVSTQNVRCIHITCRRFQFSLHLPHLNQNSLQAATSNFGQNEPCSFKLLAWRSKIEEERVLVMLFGCGLLASNWSLVCLISKPSWTCSLWIEVHFVAGVSQIKGTSNSFNLTSLDRRT